MTPPSSPQQRSTQPEREPAPDASDPLADWRVVNSQPYEPPAAQLAHLLTGFLYAFVIVLVMLACAAWLWLAQWLPIGG